MRKRPPIRPVARQWKQQAEGYILRPVGTEETCIGCGSSPDVCPAVFQLNDEIEKVGVIDEEGCDIASCCEAAGQNCPVSAIALA